MKKILPILIILVALIVTTAIAIGVKRTKTVDWEESLDEKATSLMVLVYFIKNFQIFLKTINLELFIINLQVI